MSRNKWENSMRRYVVLLLTAVFAASMVAFAWSGSNVSARVPRSTTTTTTVYVDPVFQYDQCRVDGPGRRHAIADLWAFKTDWSELEARAIVDDVDRFASVCRGIYQTGDIVRTGQVAKACLLDWLSYPGALPTVGACYAPPGNEINPFNAALLAHSL